MATILTVQQAMNYATAAGFRDNGLRIIVAIAQAESSLNTQETHRNSDGSVDRGVLQINNRWHPEVTDACAFDPACSFKAGYKISGGSNFTEWSTFIDKSYQKYLASTNTPTTVISASGGQKPWWSYHVTQPYGLPYEPGYGGHHGVDLATPMDTPITAVLPGTISSIDKKSSWGIEVGIKLDQPFNGATYMAVIHMDAVDPSLAVGQHVVPGTLLGWSGGENNPGQIGGATNPTGTHYIDSPSMTGGPHTHVSLMLGPTYGYGMGWDDPTKYPNLNPKALLDALNAGQLPQPGGAPTSPGSGQQPIGTPTGYTGTSGKVTGFAEQPITINALNNAYMASANVTHDILQSTPGFYGLISGIDSAEDIPGIYNAFTGDDNPLDAAENTVMSVLGTLNNNVPPILLRTGIVLIGLTLMLALLANAASPLLEQAGHAAELAAVAAA